MGMTGSRESTVHAPVYLCDFFLDFESFHFFTGVEFEEVYRVECQEVFELAIEAKLMSLQAFVRVLVH